MCQTRRRWSLFWKWRPPRSSGRKARFARQKADSVVSGCVRQSQSAISETERTLIGCYGGDPTVCKTRLRGWPLFNQAPFTRLISHWNQTVRRTMDNDDFFRTLRAVYPVLFGDQTFLRLLTVESGRTWEIKDGYIKLSDVIISVRSELGLIPSIHQLKN